MNLAESPTPQRRLRELIASGWITQAIRVAAELGVADLLAHGPRAAEDLARHLNLDTERLRRLLRALCSVGLFHEDSAGSFATTEIGALLAEDSPQSLHHWAKWFGSRAWPVWGQLLHSVKTGESARTLLKGSKGFEHLEQDAEGAHLFHRAMVELTRQVARDIAVACEITAAARVVDLGGGHGELMAAVLERYPTVLGVIFDQQHALQGAQAHLGERGLSARCQLVVGDFFSSVPAGADAYLCKSILHDWNDADCARILHSCRVAMKPGARLLIVEQLMPGKLEPSAEHRALAASDLHMLVALGASERSLEQFRELLVAAGLRYSRVLQTSTPFSIVEAVLDV